MFRTGGGDDIRRKGRVGYLKKLGGKSRSTISLTGMNVKVPRRKVDRGKEWHKETSDAEVRGGGTAILKKKLPS